MTVGEFLEQIVIFRKFIQKFAERLKHFAVGFGQAVLPVVDLMSNRLQMRTLKGDPRIAKVFLFDQTIDFGRNQFANFLENRFT